MPRAAILISGLAFTLAVIASPTAQVPQRRETPPNWEAWLDAVDTHVPGQMDAAVLRVAPWSLNQLESLLPRLSRLAEADLLRTVRRALVLHADVAILHRGATGYGLPVANASNTLTLFEDGRVVGQMSGTVHWDFGRLLLARALNGDGLRNDSIHASAYDRLSIGREFYRATGAVLQLWGEHPELTKHLAAGRRLLGSDDAVLLLYEGTQRQAFAAAKAQRFFEDLRRSQGLKTISTSGANAAMPSLAPALPSAGASLAQAEGLFRRALTVDGTLAEARIRLAHVLGDRGRHEDAAAELQKVATEPLSPFLDYYASLLTGREARARGQLDAARVAFERAATVYPHASAPKFGLSELALARGDRAESLTRLTEGTAASRVETDEPWWWLDRVHDPNAESLIDEMRRNVRQ